MDGSVVWSDLLREIRRRGQLSQRELARRAGVPQPNIAEIESGRREPSLSLASRIVEAAGFSVRIDVEALDRYDVLNVTSRIRQRVSVSRHDTADHRLDDDVFRIVLSFRDALVKMEPEMCRRRVAGPPGLTGSPHWDAFMAAVVEDACASHEISTPKWVALPERFHTPFWFLSKSPRLHEWELSTAPAAFLRHRIAVASDELASV